MDVNIIYSMAIISIISFLFLLFSAINYFKSKSLAQKIRLFISLGLFMTYFFGFIRLFFEATPGIDMFLWRLSGSGAGITVTSFIFLFLWINEITKLKKVLQLSTLAYLVIYLFSFLFLPAYRTESESITEWVPSTFTKYMMYLGILFVGLSVFYSIGFSIKNWNKKSFIFGIGTLITLIGLAMDGLGSIEFAFYYRLGALLGVFLMFYSSMMKKK